MLLCRSLQQAGTETLSDRAHITHSFHFSIYVCHPHCFSNTSMEGGPGTAARAVIKPPLGRTILNPTPPGAGISSHRKRNSEGRWPAAAGERGGLIIRRAGDGPGTTRWGLLLILRGGGGFNHSTLRLLHLSLCEWLLCYWEH